MKILPKKHLTTKAWNKFEPKIQEKLLQQYDIILTDHHTKKELGVKILKALLRPTPSQRIQQKQKLDHAIEKVQSGIDTFDGMMDDLSESLRKQTGRGHDDDPVDLIMGKRNHTKVF